MSSTTVRICDRYVEDVRGSEIAAGVGDIINRVQGSVTISAKVLALNDTFVSMREPLRALTSST